MPPIVSVILPLSMLIISVLGVTVAYIMWTNTDPEEFVQFADRSTKHSAPQAQSEQATAIPSLAPQSSHPAAIPEASAPSVGGIFSDVGAAFSDMRSDLQKAKELKQGDPMDEDAMFSVLEEAIPEFKRARLGTASRPDDGTIEVLRLLRNKDDGSLVVEIEGKRYKSLGEINDRQTGRRFLVNVRDLASLARLGRVEIPDIPLEELIPTVPQVGDTEVVIAAEEEDLVPWEQLSIAQQIDRVLQAKIRQTPTYANRTIRIYQSPDGGILIDVDGQTFNGVGEVDEPEVQAFIQEAIHAWEERS